MEKPRPTCYWIVVASRDHARIGVEGSIIQANHGKRSALDRMRPGDKVAIYSPRETFGVRGKLQAFTALCTVEEGEVWQADLGPDFKPFRRAARYETVVDVPLMSVLPDLDFIRNKASYGAVFRFGVVKVPEPDFRIIESALTAADGPPN
ncbi:MAG TPA: EVE domain-containing protein [Spirochaetia bacterium]|nr:EVE domain-containing protein [Spirochaetia bacterium]